CRIIGPDTAWYRVADKQAKPANRMGGPKSSVCSRLLHHAGGQDRPGGARAQSDGDDEPVCRLYASSRGILSEAAPPAMETRVLVLDRFSPHRRRHRIHSLPGADSRAECFSVLSLPSFAESLPRHSGSVIRLEISSHRIQRLA